MKKYNGEKLIVSLTSFGERFEYAAIVIKHLLDTQDYKDFHLVLTVYKEDFGKLTDSIKDLVYSDRIELLTAEENLGPHLKYFYSMLKYRDLPIVTIDDDRFHSTNMLSKLVEKYENSIIRGVISHCAPVISRTRDVIDPLERWCVPWRRLHPNCISFLAMAEGFAGVLYPPNCFKDLNSEIPEIRKYLYHDDIFLRALEIKNKIPVIQCDAVYERDVLGKDIREAQTYKMEKTHDAGNAYRNSIISKLNSKLLEGFYL